MLKLGQKHTPASTAPDGERSATRGTRRGQGLVEFALSLPFLLLILLATLDMGQLFFTYIELRNAVREGVSHAARNPCDDYQVNVEGVWVDIKAADFVTGHGPTLETGTTVGPLVFTPNVACDEILFDQDVEVTVSAEHLFQPMSTSFLQRFGIGPITLSASATAKVQT